jgi:propanol-preferring alcohol dehydrogenase
MRDEQVAPLLCAGIIGYRSLKMSGVRRGGRLGMYGFGAAAHITIQAAVHFGMDVYVVSRSDRHMALAKELGAVWCGTIEEGPPEKLDGSIVFAPAGSVVPPALGHLDRGGTCAIAGIHMSEIPPLDYDRHLYQERRLVGVTANTRRDGEEFLSLAGEIGIRTRVREFPLAEANAALRALKRGDIDGAAVLRIGR